MKVGFLTKLRANFCGGFLADQWALYSLDGKKKKEYLPEFDWYRSRYINEPFDQMLNNKVVATEVLRQYVRVPEVYLVKTRAGIVDAGHCTKGRRRGRGDPAPAPGGVYEALRQGQGQRRTPPAL